MSHIHRTLCSLPVRIYDCVGLTIPATCVYGKMACSNIVSIPYDLNYFRQTPASRAIVPPATTSATRAFHDDSLDIYSLIIELDPRLTTIPPPGF